MIERAIVAATVLAFIVGFVALMVWVNGSDEQPDDYGT